MRPPILQWKVCLVLIGAVLVGVTLGSVLHSTSEKGPEFGGWTGYHAGTTAIPTPPGGWAAYFDASELPKVCRTTPRSQACDAALAKRFRLSGQPLFVNGPDLGAQGGFLAWLYSLLAK
jgi:hypothetical protein